MNNNMKQKYVHHFIWVLEYMFTIVLLLNYLTAYPLLAQSNLKNEIKVMTFNIRYGAANDGENSWQFRKDNVVKTIQAFKPDLLGLQEALKFQIDELLIQMPDYS